MKKFYLAFCCLMVCFFSVYSQPPILDEAVALEDKGDVIGPVSRECISTTGSVTKGGSPVVAVNADCPENYEFSIVVSNNCKRPPWYAQYNCWYSIQIVLNGEILYSTNNLGYQTSINYSGTFDQLPNIGSLGYPNYHSFDVIVTENCVFGGKFPVSTTRTYTQSVPFQFVSTDGNSLYTISEWAHTDTQISDPICIVDGPVICCSPDAFFLFRSDAIFSHEFSQSGSIGFTWNSKLSFSATNGVFGASNELVGSASIKKETKDLIKNQITYRIDEKIKGKDGLCVYPGYRVISKAVYEHSYQANCDGPDELVSTNVVYVPFQLQATDLCTTPPSNGCDPLSPPIINQGTGNFNDANEPIAKSSSSNGCEGYISLDFGNTDITGYSIVWSGPNGFESSDFDIEDLELGVYTYTITDACCQELEGEVDLCPNMEEGPWYQSPDIASTYCREVYCVLDDSSKSKVSCDSSSEECVTPDYIEYDYNGTDCVETHYYGGEYLGQVTGVDQVEEIVYDDQAIPATCKKLVYCQGELVDTKFETPIPAGGWLFNFGTEKCERTIMCFNQIMDEPEVQDPVIQETYNSITGLCDRTALCDGIPTPLSPIFPIYTGPWSWTEWQGCVRDVQCDVNSPTTQVAGTESFSNWSYNDNTNQCVASTVYCENDFVPGVYHTEFPNGFGSWSWESAGPLHEQCRRQVFCGSQNTIVMDYDTPQFVDSGQLCAGTSVNLYYVYCAGVNTGATTCFSDGDEITDRSRSDRKITVAPNPFVDRININGLNANEEVVIQIFSIDGKLQSFNQTSNSEIDASILDSGVYIIKIYTIDNQEILNERIVKIN